MIVRPATAQDFPQILRVQSEAFGEYAEVYTVRAWTEETLESLAEDAMEKHVLVADIDQAVVGSVRFWTVAGVCVIRLLSVRPSHQRRGIAKALLREVEAVTRDAHKLYACTMLRTARNVSLFLSLGYQPEALLPNHYDRLDLICFAKYR